MGSDIGRLVFMDITWGSVENTHPLLFSTHIFNNFSKLKDSYVPWLMNCVTLTTLTNTTKGGISGHKRYLSRVA